MTTSFLASGALPPADRLDIRGDDGLRLRPWRAGDEQGILRGTTDPEYRRWNTPRRQVDTEADATDYITARGAAYARGESAILCLTDGTDAVLGSVGLGVIDWWTRSGTAGYWVLPELRGRGLATRGLLLYSRWAFGAAGLHRIALGHAVGHVGSCRVAERGGYPAEGVLRGGMFAAGDQSRFRDMHLHARLATDPAPGAAGTASGAGRPVRG